MKNRPSLVPFFNFWRGEIEERYFKIMKPVGRFLSKSGIEPNLMTIVGCLFNALAGLVYAHGVFFWAAWLVLLAGLCDTLDGVIARLTHKQSSQGAFLDSLMARYGELFIFLGMAYFFVSGEKWYNVPWKVGIKADPWPVVLILLVLGGSFLTGYIRSRAEALGLECKPGLVERPERVLLLVAASLLSIVPQAGFLLFKIVLVILAVLIHITTLQRIFFILKKLSPRSR